MCNWIGWAFCELSFKLWDRDSRHWDNPPLFIGVLYDLGVWFYHKGGHLHD